MAMAEASIIIPACNEEKRIAGVLRRIKAVSRNYETIVVDDGSTDRTAEIAEEEKATVLRMAKNTGKGNACMEGSRRASSGKIIFIDGDMQLKPEEIPLFVKALEENDVAVGIRDMGSAPLKRRVANRIAAKLLSGAVGQEFRDVLCGFRGVRRDAMKRLELKKKGYEFESEMLLEAARKKMKIGTVPVSVRYYGEKGMGAWDGVKVLAFILKSRITSS